MFSRRSSICKNEKMFDSFMEFLRSELWKFPISEFIEQQSIVFDRDTNVDNVALNNDAYKALFAEFHKIVNDLLDAHCSDGGTTRDQLMATLKSTEQTKDLSKKDRLLLEPIVAAQDFNVFVPMMMRKNIELQLQALKMIEHLNGLLPSSLKLGQKDAEMWNSLGDEDESDRFIMISVLKQSHEEWERDQRLEQELLAQMETALRESLLEKSALEEMRRREQMLFEQALNKSEHSFNSLSLKIEEAEKVQSTSADKSEITEKLVKFDEKSNLMISPSSTASDTTNSELPKEQNAIEKRRKSAALLNAHPNGSPLEEKPPITEKKRISLGQVHAPLTQQKRAVPLEDPKNGDLAYRRKLKERDNGISESQLRDRKQYLLDQRDKLLKKKSEERERQLIEAAKQKNNSRPQTAKAARELMEQKNEVEEVRRRIAAKIKAEVMKEKSN